MDKTEVMVVFFLRDMPCCLAGTCVTFMVQSSSRPGLGLLFAKNVYFVLFLFSIIFSTLCHFIFYYSLYISLPLSL